MKVPRLYTSRYSNPELGSGEYTVVGITRGAPKFALHYTLAGNIIEIAPPGYLFNEYDRTRFTKSYFLRMDKIGATRIYELLNGYLQIGKDVVLCCYEDVRKPNEWCHRLVFAEWWMKQTGESIIELPDPSPVKQPASREKKKEEPQVPDGIQLSMW